MTCAIQISGCENEYDGDLDYSRMHVVFRGDSWGGGGGVCLAGGSTNTLPNLPIATPLTGALRVAEGANP